MIRLIIYSFILILSFKLNAQTIDSLKNSLKNQNHDTIILNTYLKIGQEFYYSGNIDSALNNYNIGLKKSIALNLPKYICTFYSECGLMYREKGIYNKANEFLLSALKVADDQNFEIKKASCYNGIAIIYSIQKNYNKAFEFYNKAMVIYQKKGKLSGQASINNNLGLIYLDQKKFDEALGLFHRAKDLNKQNKNDYGLAANLENIGIIHENKKRMDSAQTYLIKAYSIWKSRNDTHSLAINMSYIGNLLIKQQKFQYAIDTLLKALNFAKRIQVKTSERDLSYYLSGAYEKLGDLKTALNYYKQAKQLGDSILNDDKLREITEMQLNYAFNKRQIEDSLKYQLEVAGKEKELIAQKKNTGITLVILGIILILLFYVIKGYLEKNKANTLITQQKILVEQKQLEILDSINYAKKIQNTLLANADFLNQNLNSYFVYYNPKDIVSGDFYWATKRDNKFYIAACDSTGHGVPGAFMSLLNIGFLSEAINEKGIEEPNLIFDFVRESLTNNLGKDGQKDGFDGILICMDQKTKTITYAAANNKPILIINGVQQELPSDRMPVGAGERKEPFNLYSIEKSNEAVLYLYTDGYADQFGGPKGKKFKYKQLNELLLTHHSKSMFEQKEILKTTFDSWKGKLEQVDDVCVIGIII
ncbi:MAG: tetratricopeptide repeat protein [Bacteroidetes bacterium]|nr:tetratricopeptide repeat protein [Bacteroidota bacterium]MCA6444170.1 tetratricopeptide repeat protein [Bacteroidota bacterium]